jgi:uncharacterized membrane protein YhdT
MAILDRLKNWSEVMKTDHPEQPVSRAARASVTKTVVVLYLAFFLLWCIGAAIGEFRPAASQPRLWGMPLWFAVSCLLSFAGVSAALVLYVRRWLR